MSDKKRITGTREKKERICNPASATTSVRNTFKQRVSDTFRFRAGTQFGTQVQRYNIGAIEQQC